MLWPNDERQVPVAVNVDAPESGRGGHSCEWRLLEDGDGCRVGRCGETFAERGKWVLCDRGRGAVGVEQVSRKGG